MILKIILALIVIVSGGWTVYMLMKGQMESDKKIYDKCLLCGQKCGDSRNAFICIPCSDKTLKK